MDATLSAAERRALTQSAAQRLPTTRCRTCRTDSAAVGSPPPWTTECPARKVPGYGRLPGASVRSTSAPVEDLPEPTSSADNVFRRQKAVALPPSDRTRLGHRGTAARQALQSRRTHIGNPVLSLCVGSA
jgi:hypothetical protein